MTTELPKYQRNRRCPKCGERGAATFYRRNDLEAAPMAPRCEGERLERTCQNCQYEWNEKVIKPEKAI
jgi:hypothetical protein